METRRTWQVLLFGGASGVGKTSVSYRLAHAFGVGLTEVDDFQIVLERLTTPEQQPALHYFRLHTAEVLRMDDEQMLAHTLSVADAMSVQVRAVFLYEEDEQQILRNFRARAGEEQPRRARASWYYSEWLRREAARLGLPAVPAQPWHTVLERVIAALQPA